MEASECRVWMEKMGPFDLSLFGGVSVVGLLRACGQCVVGVVVCVLVVGGVVAGGVAWWLSGVVLLGRMRMWRRR